MTVTAELGPLGAGTGWRTAGLATLRHMHPEPTQLPCSKLFPRIQFMMGTLVSEKACQIQALKDNTPSDQENKEAFLEREREKSVS